MTAVLPDVPTIYLMTGLVSIVGAAIPMWLREPEPLSRRAIPSIAISILTTGIGFALLGLRGIIAVDVATGIANIFFGVAALYLWLGTARLLGRPRRAAPAAALTAVYSISMLALLGPAPDQMLWRKILSLAFYIAFLGLSAREVVRSPLLGSLRAVRLLLALFVVFAAILAVQLSLYLTSGVTLQADGMPVESLACSLFALAFGTIPFSLAIIAHGVIQGRLNAHLRELATTDMLTGLVSRRTLHEKGPSLLERSDCPVAFLMIDLDDFKQINDEHGHATGDLVLQHLATVLRSCLRQDALVVRYGGDEFCALVPVHDEAAATSIAERIRATIEATPYLHGDIALPVTISIGVSVHRSGRTLRDLLDEADRYAYDAKSLGRNRVMAATAATATGNS